MLNSFRTLTSGILAKVNKQLITSKADWNQNDSNQLNYIKNRPFYTEIKEGENVYVDDTFTFEQVDETMCMLNTTCDFSLVAGDKYYVDFEGETYGCVGISVPSNGLVYVGNESLIGGADDTGEPFTIGILDGEMMAYALIPTVSIYAAAATYDYRIKIYQSGKQEIVHKLDEKYLPKSYELLQEEVENNYTYLNNRITNTNNNIVQSDWNETSTTSKAYIKNKPTIPMQVQSDWNETSTTSKAYIKNKPTMANYLLKSNYVEPANADWNEETSSKLSFIKNKPDLSVYVEKDSLEDYSFDAHLRGVSVCNGDPYGSLPNSIITDSSMEFYPNGFSRTGMTDDIRIEAKTDASAHYVPYFHLFGHHVDENGVTRQIKPRINNVGTPVEDYDAVNKLYIDETVNEVKTSIEGTIEETTSEINNKIVQSDWSVNDSANLSYVKNRPFGDFKPVYTTIFEHTIPSDDFINSENGHVTIVTETQLVDGEKYRLYDSWSNITYTGYCVDGSLKSSKTTISNSGDDSFEIYIDHLSSTDCDIKIEKISYTAQPIDEKYIPETIARKEYVDSKSTMLVTVQSSNTRAIEASYVADKTYAEIYAHIQNGGNAVVYNADMGMYLNFSTMEESAIYFTCNMVTSASSFVVTPLATDRPDITQFTCTITYDDIIHFNISSLMIPQIECPYLETENKTIEGAINEVNTLVSELNAKHTEGTDSLILLSPNGTRFTITVGDDGVLSATEITEGGN